MKTVLAAFAATFVMTAAASAAPVAPQPLAAGAQAETVQYGYGPGYGRGGYGRGGYGRPGMYRGNRGMHRGWYNGRGNPYRGGMGGFRSDRR